MPKNNSKDLKLYKIINKESKSVVNKQHTLLFIVLQRILCIVLLIVLFYSAMILAMIYLGGESLVMEGGSTWL